MSERMVDIECPTARLDAVLHMPDQAPPRGAVLIVPSELGDRLGPNRAGVRLARRFAAVGYAVIRYDGVGCGASGGEPISWLKAAARTEARRGQRADEIVGAARTLALASGCRDLVVVTFRGGIYQAIHLFERAPDLVRGLFGVGPPALVPSATTPATLVGRDPDESSPSWQRRTARRYIRRATSLTAWRRLWRGDSDCEAILHSVATALSREPAEGSLARRSMAAAWKPVVELSAARKAIACAWGEHDPARFAFEDFVRNEVEGQGATVSTHTIAGGDRDCCDGQPFAELTRLVIAFADRVAAPRRAIAPV
jgi:pimeloyl-ACP methyl ester carboxylesterase